MNPFITLTGADEMTDLGKLITLDAEIGLLYTFDSESRNRYPRKEWIIDAARFLPRVAIHICGTRARGELHFGLLDNLIADAKRIQINGNFPSKIVNSICARYSDKIIINQLTQNSCHFLGGVSAPNHALLVDVGRPLVQSRGADAGALSPDSLDSRYKNQRH